MPQGSEEYVLLMAQVGVTAIVVQASSLLRESRLDNRNATST
jgi:hypothetical protein